MKTNMIHNSDRGIQYLSMQYIDKITYSSMIASISTIDDSYDNALAEIFNGLYKSEVIEYLKEQCHHLNDVELATLGWVNSFNKIHLHSTIGCVSPFEF